MSYPLYLIFAFLPSIIWLLFYLRKDVHPESKGMIVKIFFYGMFAALPAAFIEFGFSKIIVRFGFDIPQILISLFYWFLAVALVEELLKYLVVKEKALSSPEFDEPVDAMLYMIISALGFATSENILIFWTQGTSFHFFETFLVSSLRFLGATFLHALCSGIFGYFLALSFFETKKRYKTTLMGLAIATFLHGLYNFSIMEIEENLKFIIPVIILATLAFAISWGFKRLRKIYN